MVLCYLWLVYLVWCWYGCPEVETSCTDFAQLSRVYLKTETESSLRNVVLLNKKRATDNVPKHNVCTIILIGEQYQLYYTGTIKVSLNHTLSISLHYSTHRVFKSHVQVFTGRLLILLQLRISRG
jgi:hypothetical protein